jgi:hypothetical protein
VKRCAHPKPGTGAMPNQMQRLHSEIERGCSPPK